MNDTQKRDEITQRLGRRLGLTPYYNLSEHGAQRLRLESRPEANRRPGLAIIALGVALLLLAALIAISGLLAATRGAGFAVGAAAAVVAGLLGGPGYQRVMGGYAVLSTHNSIVADTASATLRFDQRNRLAGERTQALRFAQIEALRLRRRPLLVGWPFRRAQPIVVLELLVGTQVWVVDSAIQPEQLRPAAEALSEILGMGFSQEG